MYDPIAVPPGKVKFADAVPAATVADVTGEPIVVPPLFTVNVTVPPAPVPAPDVTFALKATVWFVALNVAV